MAMQKPAATRVDPTVTTRPGTLKELQRWISIDTARQHQPVWLVVNPAARAPMVRNRLPASGAGTRPQRHRCFAAVRSR